MTRRKRSSLSAADAYALAGCDGESMAADFIAMEMAGYGPADHGDFLMDALCPGGDPDWHRSTRAAAAAAAPYGGGRSERRLAKLGVAVEKRNDGIHWLLMRAGKRVGDYWPTTTRWKLGEQRGRGIDELVKALKAAGTGEAEAGERAS